MRGAHLEHDFHVRDAGRVEAQWLVERQRLLPSRKEGRTMRSEVWAVGGRAWASSSARAACTGRGPGCDAVGRLYGMRGAHGKHVEHVRDAGRVEAERLVERRRVLPSRKEGVRCGARCVGREAGGRGPAAAHERHARGEGPAVKAGEARSSETKGGYAMPCERCGPKGGGGRGREDMGRRQRTSGMHGERARL